MKKSMKNITTKPKPFCFVLMPFDDAFDDTYELGIKDACKKAGAYCERVDEQLYEGSIVERIYNQIDKADFIVADMQIGIQMFFMRQVMLMLWANMLFF